MASHRILFADSRRMDELAPESVHIIVTSPPYWCIKDYAHPGQTGYEQEYGEYLADLTQVLAECHRVLHPGCRAAVNIGDQYLRASEHGRYRVQPIPADLIRAGVGLGFDFMGNIIWQKISTTNTSGGGALMGSMYFPKDGHVTYEHEYIILFRKQGKWPKPSPERQEQSRLTKQQRSEWFRGIWRVPPERQGARSQEPGARRTADSDDPTHGAVFPVEVPRRLIRMYSFHGETVLDPFLGTGTTALAAELEGRNSVGYEINEAFRPLIEGKLGLRQATLLPGPEVEFVTREA